MKKKIDIVEEVLIDDLLFQEREDKAVDAAAWLLKKMFVQDTCNFVPSNLVFEASREFDIKGYRFFIAVGINCDEDGNFNGKFSIKAEWRTLQEEAEWICRSAEEANDCLSSTLLRNLYDGIEYHCRNIQNGVRKMLAEVINAAEIANKYQNCQ